MRDVIRAVDRGQVQSSPEKKARISSAARLAAELEAILNDQIRCFVDAHPDIDLTIVGQSLLMAAAVQCGARLGMTPADFAVLAGRVAELAQHDATALRIAVLGEKP